jgi:hypothetical protein
MTEPEADGAGCGLASAYDATGAAVVTTTTAAVAPTAASTTRRTTRGVKGTRM